MPKLTYFKRHRMELELRHARPTVELPAGFYWLPWHQDLLEVHARVKFLCFQGETDSKVFPGLATIDGCRELMTAIASRPGFSPAATWLVAGSAGCVGTVQGLKDANGYGGIQNLGVIPGYRGKGIGRALLLKALEGFEKTKAPRAFLEVTALNRSAMNMYRSLGFRSYQTLYRGVQITSEGDDSSKPLYSTANGTGI